MYHIAVWKVYYEMIHVHGNDADYNLGMITWVQFWKLQD